MKDNHCAEHEKRTVAIASLEAKMNIFKVVFGGGMTAVLLIGLYMFGSIATDIGFVRSDIALIKKDMGRLDVVENEIIHINKQLGEK